MVSLRGKLSHQHNFPSNNHLQFYQNLSSIFLEHLSRKYAGVFERISTYIGETNDRTM